MIEYRKANFDDISDLVELRIEFMKEAINEDYKRDDVQMEKALREYFEVTIKNDSFIAWLAVDDGKIIATSGLIFYTRPPSYKNMAGEVAYIMNMYTVPAFRCRGIATSLFERTLKEAKSRGYKKVCLNATKKGKPLYEKFGFLETEGEMELDCV